jgi:peptidoglycan/LPS O-acetylase OafA/YrhL
MRAPAAPLEQPFSLYLDLARFTAAVLVVVAHYTFFNLVNPGTGALLPDLGREAVMIFFVLSGFVIAYTTEHKGHSLWEYTLARCARIYSVAAPVVLLSFAIATVAVLLFGAQVGSGYQVYKPYIYLPLHFLFLGELWNLTETPPWLPPYWSLAYEVWYYVLFAALYYLKGVRRIVVGGLVFALLGPKLWLLLPVWMSGVWLYHWQKTHTVGPSTARIGVVLTLVALGAYEVFDAEAHLRALGRALWPFPSLPLASADRFLADYVMCGIVVANFLFARFAGFDKLQRAAAPIRRLASYSFTLYLTHGLVIGIWTTFYPHDTGSVADIAAVTLLIVAATWSLGLVTEGRKDWFHARLANWGGAVRHVIARRAVP